MKAQMLLPRFIWIVLVLVVLGFLLVWVFGSGMVIFGNTH